jgi:hydroxylamine oxidation protein HaoB
MADTGKALAFIGLFLVAGGLFLAVWAALAFLRPVPAPYAYVLVGEGGVAEFPDLGLDGDAFSDLTIRKYELRAAQVDRPLAVLHAAIRGSGSPVLLDWRNELAEPVVNTASDISQTVTLAEALREHTPADSLVIAWWDVSRRLKLLAGADVLFDRHLARPLLIPQPWDKYRDSIEATERRFWKAGPAPSDEKRFERFVDALLSDPQAGTEKLRALGGRRQAFLVLSLRDAYKLGAMRPDRFGVGFKDFPKGGDVHGAASAIKRWLEAEGYDSYAIQPLEEGIVRVYFLTDEPSAATLLARALPFTSSRPLELTSPSLVYQQGEFWVYELAAGVAAGG